MCVGVIKDWKPKLRDLHVSHTLGYRETGTPKDRDEVNKRDVCECVGLHMCEREKQLLYYEWINRESKTVVIRLFVDTQNRLVVLHSVLIKTHEETDIRPHSVIYRVSSVNIIIPNPLTPLTVYRTVSQVSPPL